MPEVKELKQQIRKETLKKLREISLKTREEKSNLICEKLKEIVIKKSLISVMGYCSTSLEVNIYPFIYFLLERYGKIILPKIDKGEIVPLSIDNMDNLTNHNRYKIKEPIYGKKILPQEIELVIIPGIAFDKKGRRLGHGKGYYDRFLKRVSSKTLKIGVCFDIQLFPSLPFNEWDECVNMVITESNLHVASIN